MPIYDFRCNHCNYSSEIFQSINDASTKPCPKCGNQSFEKCVSAPKVRLSGTGYYETDEKPKAKQRHIATSDNHEPAK